MKNIVFISAGLALLISAKMFKKRLLSGAVSNEAVLKKSTVLPLQSLQVMKSCCKTINEEWKFYLN